MTSLVLEVHTASSPEISDSVSAYIDVISIPGFFLLFFHCIETSKTPTAGLKQTITSLQSQTNTHAYK